jgi:hypothetical protein
LSALIGKYFLFPLKQSGKSIDFSLHESDFEKQKKEQREHVEVFWSYWKCDLFTEGDYGKMKLITVETNPYLNMKWS